MGKVYTPTSVGSGVQTTTTLNSNFTNIETALQDVLSRSGATPNAMAANLDMGNNNIINGNTGNFVDIVVGGTSIVAQVTAAAASAAAALASENAAATSEANAATSESNASASATLASQWASLTGALVAATDYSSKEYAIGTTVAAGSAKDWATITGSFVDGAEYSAKEYAIGTTVASGSAKDWAQEAEDVLVDGSGYSAFHWAQKAMAIVGGVAGLVSSNDTTADYLVNKFTALHGLTWTEINDGGNEDLQIGIGGQLLVLAGTAAAPGITFQTDTNTGIYSDGADVIGFSGNGTRLAFMNTTALNGNVAGSYSLVHGSAGSAASPTYRFQGDVDTGMYSPSSNVITFSTGGTNRFSIDSASLFGSAVTNAPLIRSAAGTAATPTYTFYGDSDTGMYSTSANAISWSTSGTARIHLVNGLYAQGATGTDKGAGTINFSNHYGNGYLFFDGSPPSGFEQGGCPMISDQVGAHTSQASVTGAWTASTWESAGPTGSGADNVWTALDSNPSDARFVILRIRNNIQGSTTASSYKADLYGRAGNSAASASDDTLISRVSFINRSGAGELDENTNMTILPLDTADGTFDLYWSEIGTTPTSDIEIRLVGWL